MPKNLILVEPILIVFVSKAHVGIEHHFVDAAGFGVAVDALPLVFSGITVNGEFHAPPFQKNGAIVVIVECSLVRRIAPEAVEARVGNPCLAKGVSARNSSREFPSI